MYRPGFALPDPQGKDHERDQGKSFTEEGPLVFLRGAEHHGHSQQRQQTGLSIDPI